jgi:hypothetical protein
MVIVLSIGMAGSTVSLAGPIFHTHDAILPSAALKMSQLRVGLTRLKSSDGAFRDSKTLLPVGAFE